MCLSLAVLFSHGQVGAINFSPFYRNPADDGKIRVEDDSSGIVTVLCSDDVLTGAGYRIVSGILCVGSTFLS